MRVTRLQAAQNRESVLNAAARLFRERGLLSTGVAEVMSAVGLTHGGFYAQFPGGKDALAAEAIGLAFRQRQASWEEASNGKSRTAALASIKRGYLSKEHFDNPGDGCAVPVLGADA